MNPPQVPGGEWIMRIMGTATELLAEDQRLYLETVNLAVDPPHFGFTADAQKARAFEHAGAVLELWRTTSTARPRRDDGKPNRPLTAFSIMAERRPARSDPSRRDEPRSSVVPASDAPRVGASETPTAWAVICQGRQIFLTYTEYLRQLSRPDSRRWICPDCGRDAEFDDANYAARLGGHGDVTHDW